MTNNDQATLYALPTEAELKTIGQYPEDEAYSEVEAIIDYKRTAGWNEKELSHVQELQF